jgi:ribonuclease HI
MLKLDIFVDGACSGNPGPAGIGIVIKKDGTVIKEIARSIGSATNNIAEYTALIYALQEALALKAQQVHVTTDSELMHRQVIGLYKVKHGNIKPLFDQVKHLMQGFEKFELTHVPREANAEADKLSRQGVLKQVINIDGHLQ